MTPSQKILMSKLLCGHFLKKFSLRGKSWYVLYDEKISPLQKIRTGTVDKIDRFMDPDLKLWKKSKDGRISLNLSTVRQLHGRHTLNRMYKKKSEADANSPIYKRKSKTKKKISNEKVHTLFGDL